MNYGAFKIYSEVLSSMSNLQLCSFSIVADTLYQKYGAAKHSEYNERQFSAMGDKVKDENKWFALQVASCESSIKVQCCCVLFRVCSVAKRMQRPDYLLLNTPAHTNQICQHWTERFHDQLSHNRCLN